MNAAFSQTIDPIVIKRVRGGFLAVSPRRAAISIGAIGATEEEARYVFQQLVDSWISARDSEFAGARVGRDGT
jgi:hypothetical protein